MIVTNANSYTGGTIVENGILQVNNASGSATGTGAVTVKSGGTLSGLPTAQGIYEGITGSISGSVEVQSGGELLAQSGGTLTLGGLSLNAGSLSVFHLGALTAASLVNITGENLFTLPGASTVEITNTGLMQIGTYRLFDYSGADPVFNNLSLAASHIGMYNLALDYNMTDKRIDLLVSAITNQWIKGGNTNWSNAANWSENNVPDSPGETALFMNNAGQPGFGPAETATVDTSKTVGAVTFDNTATAFTINASSGQTLTLDGAGGKAVIQSLRAAPADHVISAPLILAADLTVNVAAGSHGVDISGSIAGEGKSLSKTGSGSLTLSGESANTYSGLTRVESGTLYLNKTAGVDAVGAGGLDIATGAVAALMASNQVVDTATVSVAGTLALGTNSETVAAVTGAGQVTTGTGSVLTIANNAYSEFLGTISGQGGIAKAGSGILRLAGANSYSGGTAINGGTLRVGADNRMGDPSGVLTFDGGTILFAGGFTSGRDVGLNSGGGTLDTSGNDISLTGAVSGSGTLTKEGDGTLTLGHSNSYTGATIVNNGILRVTDAYSLGSAAAGTTVNANGEVELDGAGLTVNEPLTLNGGAVCSLTGTNTYGGAVTLTANSVIDADGDKLIINSVIGQSGGSYGLTKEGPGIVELTNANTYTGRTVVEQGTLKLTGGSAIADTGAVRMDNTAGATLLLNAHETIGSLEGGGSTGGNVELGASTLTTGGDNTSTTFGGVVSGSGSLIKAGTGTMTLTGVNAHTGGTTISEGALSVGNSHALGLESNTLAIGAGATLKTTGSFDTSRATSLGGAGSGVGGIFETDSGTTLEYTSTSVISGSGSLIKTGAGTLLLDGVNTYAGGTYIKEGTLTLTNSQSAGPQPAAGSSDYALHIYDGAALRETGSSWTTERKVELVSGIATIGITPASTVTNKGEIYGSGALNLTGGGTIIVTGANTYAGGTVVQEGVLQANNTSGSATGTGDVTVKMGGTLSGLTDTSATGSVSGKVTVESGGRLLAESGETLTFNLGGLELKGGAVSSLQIGAPTTTSVVTVTTEDKFTLTGASTVEITSSGQTTAGTYRLFDYSGTDPAFANLTLANRHSGLFGLELVYNQTDKRIDLAVADVTNWWDKSGVNTNWSNTANWWNGDVPNGAGETALFIYYDQIPFNPAETVTVDTSTTVGSLTFNNDATAFTVNASSGQTLTLDGGGSTAHIEALKGPAAGHVINAPVILASDTSVYVTAPGTNGLDIKGVVSGDGDLIKSGAGVLKLSGTAANTYTGLTRVEGGTLYLNKPDGVAAVGAAGMAVYSQAAVALIGNNQIPDSVSLDLNGTFVLGTYSETVAALNGAGQVTTGVGSVLTVAGDGDSAFSGTISGLGGIVKAGAGILTLSGSNSHSGGTKINGGIVRVGADKSLGAVAGTLTLDSGTLLLSGNFTSGRSVALESGGGTLNTNVNNLELTGVISGAGPLTKAGAGTLKLSNTNTFTGATAITGGILQLGTNNALYDSTAVTVASGAYLDVNSKSDTIGSLAGAGNVLLGSGTLAAGASGVSTTYTGVMSGTSGNFTKVGTGTMTLTAAQAYTGTTAVAAGTLSYGADNVIGTGNVTTSGGYLNLGAYSDTVGTVQVDGGGILGTGTLTSAADYDMRAGTAAVVLAGAVGLNKTGDGTVVLAGRNTYTGATTVSAGTLQNGARDVIPDGMRLTVASGARYDVNGYTETIRSITSSGAIAVGTGTLDISGWKSTVPGLYEESYFYGDIIGSGKLSIGCDDQDYLVKTDSYIYSAATFTGTLKQKQGWLTLSGNGALTSASDIVLKSGGDLWVDNYDKNADRLNNSGTVTLRGGTLTLWGNEIAATTETVGTVHAEAGESALTVYSGGNTTTLNITTLQRDKGATLLVDFGDELGVTEKIMIGSGANPVNGILPYATTTADGVNYYFTTYDAVDGIKPTTNSDYVTSFAAAGDTSNVKLSGTVTPLAAGSKTINALIIDGASVSGETGATLIVASGGIVISGGSGTIDVSVPVIQFNGQEGIIQSWGDHPVTISSKISGGGGVTFDDWGSNGIVLNSNTSDYTGGTYICSGTLRYGMDNALPTAGAVTVTGDGLLDLNGKNATVASLNLLDGWFTPNGGTLTAGAYTLSGGTLDFNLSGAGLLTKALDETFTINGYVSSYTGNIDVTAGKLVVHTDMSSSDVIVRSGAILAGAGASFGNVTVEPGGTWLPGDSPGTQTLGSLTWYGGSDPFGVGGLGWEIDDADGTKGVNWDWINITGNLTIDASAMNQITIDLISLLPGTDTPGNAADLNPNIDWMWPIMTVGGDISGFDSSYFKLIDNIWNNNSIEGSGFFIGIGIDPIDGKKNLMVAYSPTGTDPWADGGDVPEPSTLLLLLPFIGFGVRKLRRK